MRIVHRLLLVIMAALQTLFIAAQKNPLHAYLPADAKTIININLPSMASKMSWQDIQQLSFFEESLKEAPLAVQEFLKNPAATGINFFGDFFIVLMPDSKNASKNSGYLYGSIADTAKFRAAMQKMAPKQKIKTAGNMRLLADEKTIIAWTPEVFVMPMSKKERAVNKKLPDAKAKAAEAKELLGKCRRLLTAAANPVTGNERFMELARETGDVRLWVNRNITGPQQKGKKADEVLKMLNLGMMQQGNYMAGVLRFENGKAVMQMKSYMNKTMDSLYRLYPATTLNQNLLRKFPGGVPVALMTFSVSPEMLGAMIKTIGVDKLMDSLSKKSSIKPMDVISGLNGDLTLAVIRANEFEEKDTVTAALNGLQIFIAASVKNKAKLQPLLDQLQKPKEHKEGEEMKSKSKNPFGGLKPAFLLNDSFVVMSISPFAAEKFLASTGDNDITELVSPYASHPSLFALDLDAIFGFAMQMSKKKAGDEQMAKVQETFDKIIFYGGKYDTGAMLSTAELHFKNKQENSLKQFMTLLEVAAAMEMKKKNSSHVEDAPVEN